VARRVTWVRVSALGVVASVLALQINAGAENRALAPVEIVKRALDHVALRSGGAEMTLRLQLRSPKGEVSTRTLYARSRRVDGLSRTLVRVLAPSDVAGSAFLFLERPRGEAELYLYLPALKVVKRIVGEQRRASFMGSELTYADLEWGDVANATCTESAAEKIGAHACHVVDCVPRRTEGYRKIRIWVRQQDFVPLRVHFFDQQREPLKTLFVKEVTPVEGQPMATFLAVVNRRTGYATELQLSNIHARADLRPEDFTPQSLQER
jgi:hypothetical protein